MAVGVFYVCYCLYLMHAQVYRVHYSQWSCSMYAIVYILCMHKFIEFTIPRYMCALRSLFGLGLCIAITCLASLMNSSRASRIPPCCCAGALNLPIASPSCLAGEERLLDAEPTFVCPRVAISFNSISLMSDREETLYDLGTKIVVISII